MKLSNNKYVSIILALVLISSILSGKIFLSKHKNNEALMGVYMNLPSHIDTSFASNFMDSSYLVKVLKNNYSKTIKGKVISVSAYIKKQNIIIVNIGEYDINKTINSSEHQYDFLDKEILERQINILLTNVDFILSLIKEINHNCSIKLCEITNTKLTETPFINDIYNEINDNYHKLAIRYNAYII